MVRPVERFGIFSEELKAIAGWNLCDDRLPTVLDVAPSPRMVSAIPVKRSCHAECEDHEADRNDDRDEIAHLPLCYQTVSASRSTLEKAYAACIRLATNRYENFPVASWLLPAGMRRPIAAVYAFARYADDFADEGDRSNAERLALLQDWRERLHRAGTQDFPETSDERDLIFVALAHTIRSCNLPVALFDDLLSAFEQDVVVHRYHAWSDLLDYCRRSANPVGRLVLRIADYHDEKLDRASDCVCTALQLTNFLQDFDRDWQRARLYVPIEVYTSFGADEAGLEQPRLPAEWRASLKAVAERTCRIFDDGRAVCDGVAGRLGLELRLTWLAGRRIIDRLDRCEYDSRANRPTLGFWDGPSILWRAARW